MMLDGPYRAPTFTEPVAPRVPWWQRLQFYIDRDYAAQQWPWARRAIGGRWTRALSDRGWLASEWKPVERCPARSSLQGVDYVDDRQNVAAECERFSPHPRASAVVAHRRSERPRAASPAH